MQLYPAVLTDSLETFQQEIDLVRVHPDLSTVHVDVVDGFFADNLTITPLDLIDINLEGLEMVFHLMVNEPLDFVFEMISIKERLPIKGVVAQIERMSSQYDFIQEVKRYGWEVGLSLDLHTPLEEIEAASWDQLDSLQLMSIEAGFQGTEFSPLVFPKITEAQNHLKSINHTLELTLDGGINTTNVEKIVATGIDGIIVGSAIWKSTDPNQTINIFKAETEGA